MLSRILTFLFVCSLVTSSPVGAQNLPAADAEFRPLDMRAVKLGQLLFYDPILSGNKSVSCATCHHTDHGTSDGLSLGIGDGGIGLGPSRVIDPKNRPEQRIPRNAPALFNLGASEFDTMFHDGRLEADPTKPGGIRTPLGEDMVDGFDSVLSAQAMFPVLSPDEMAGHYNENDVSRAVRQGILTGPTGAWAVISQRIEDIPDYRSAFDEVIGAGHPIRFTDIANMIAAFIEFEWRADDSPFDRHLRGQDSLTGDALAGMELFYGKAKCAACHSGQFQTDHQFHAIAMPQIGPGKAARFETHAQDTGRKRVTGQAADAYSFRTPSLRNVTATAPYGHAGAYGSLRAAVQHHFDPVANLRTYGLYMSALPQFVGAQDDRVLQDTDEMDAIAAANVLSPTVISDVELDQLLAFLDALTDPTGRDGRLGVPSAVPSGLPVD